MGKTTARGSLDASAGAGVSLKRPREVDAPMAAKKAPKRPAGKATARKTQAKKAPAKKAASATMRRARAEKTGGEEAVLAYVRALPAWQRAIAERLHAVVMGAEPGVEPAVKWSMPTYAKGGLLCYVAPFSKHVGFGFYQGAGIPDLDAAAADRSAKGNRHVKLTTPEDVDEARFRSWVRAAVAINARR